VNCDYAVQKLLEKDMIVMQGKSDGPGRPMLYATSQAFMDYFGIKNVTDLPQLKDLRAPQNEIGTASESMDDNASEVETLVLNETNGDVFSEETIATTEITETVYEDSEETIITDENPELSELPDRKKIFLENEDLQDDSLRTNEISSSSDEEDLPS